MACVDTTVPFSDALLKGKDSGAAQVFARAEALNVNGSDQETGSSRERHDEQRAYDPFSQFQADNLSHQWVLDAKRIPLPLEAWLKEEPAHERRARLLEPGKIPPTNISVWGLIKDVVAKGGDLSRVATPVQLLEPLSELQQRCEDLEYTELLDQAATLEPKSLDRLLLVAAFSLSAYSGVKRTCKPFNAMLGETYEFACPEKGFRFIAEKVQHVPTTINHVIAEGRGWTFELEDELHTRFTGTAIELHPIVLLQVAFHDGDTYQFHKAVTSINNVIMGKLYLDHKGAYTVQCLGSGGLCARMKFHASSMLTSKAKLHEVSGVVEKDGKPIKDLKLKGKWDEELSVHMPDGSVRQLWKVNPPAPEQNRFTMSQWVVRLNDLTPQLRGRLPLSDTRLRPDINCLEQGAYDAAAAHHRRLEELQEAAAAGARAGKAHEPRWFSRDPGAKIGEQYVFRYRGGYWEARAAGAFSGKK